MSREGLKIEDGGFPVYTEKHLGKLNALRRAASQPDSDSPIIPTKGQALFTTAEEMHDEPASCYNCQMYNPGAGTCSIIGSRIPVRKFSMDGVEYWPCCSMQLYGEPASETSYNAQCDPDYLGLVWINAPETGQKLGGATCGGCNGSDDCDHFLTDGKTEKWDSPTGFCRALQTQVACGDVCSIWQDDDQLGWREAVKILNERNS